MPESCYNFDALHLLSLMRLTCWFCDYVLGLVCWPKIPAHETFNLYYPIQPNLSIDHVYLLSQFSMGIAISKSLIGWRKWILSGKRTELG